LRRLAAPRDRHWSGRWDLNPRPSLAATPMSSGLMGPREEFDVAARSSEGLSPPNPPLDNPGGLMSPHIPSGPWVQSTRPRETEVRSKLRSPPRFLWSGRWDLNPRPSLAAARSSEGLSPPNPPLTTPGGPTSPHIPPGSWVQSTEFKNRARVKLRPPRDFWSGRWDLNPRPSAWEADALPLSYARSSSHDYTTRWLMTAGPRTHCRRGLLGCNRGCCSRSSGTTSSWTIT